MGTHKWSFCSIMNTVAVVGTIIVVGTLEPYKLSKKFKLYALLGGRDVKLQALALAPRHEPYSAHVCALFNTCALVLAVLRSWGH